MSPPSRIVVPVHYDFASTLCYVAHRVLGRIAPQLDALGVELQWTPVDLAGLLNWKRGALVSEERRANAARVSRDLEVPVVAPRTWLDSRTSMALGLRIEREDVEASWRERVWTSIFEAGGSFEGPSGALSLAGELGISSEGPEIDAGLAELERLTLAAAEVSVVGAPTLMLGGFPIGGIQTDEVMLSMLQRYAKRVRQDAANPPALQ